MRPQLFFFLILQHIYTLPPGSSDSNFLFSLSIQPEAPYHAIAVHSRNLDIKVILSSLSMNNSLPKDKCTHKSHIIPFLIPFPPNPQSVVLVYHKQKSTKYKLTNLPLLVSTIKLLPKA
jgi:hypothetical protein